jgi:hypothetical protein
LKSVRCISSWIGTAHPSQSRAAPLTAKRADRKLPTLELARRANPAIHLNGSSSDIAVGYRDAESRDHFPNLDSPDHDGCKLRPLTPPNHDTPAMAG